MKKGYRLTMVAVLEIAIILALQSAMLHWLAKKQVVAAILSAGEQVPATWLGLAVVFVVLRFFTLVVIPGVVLQRLLKLSFYFFVERRQEPLENADRPANTNKPVSQNA